VFPVASGVSFALASVGVVQMVWSDVHAWPTWPCGQATILTEAHSGS